MICPNCGSDDLQVLDTRACNGGIRRRRNCKDCDTRFTTYETISEQKKPRNESMLIIIDGKTYKLMEEK